jgi:drug/metabolite transporter (DMT)-like permease
MRARIVWLVLCAIWGSTWLFIKMGLDDLPPFSFAGIRFVIAAAVLFGIAFARRSRLPDSAGEWGYLALTGLLAFTINYGAVFWGEQRISSGLAAVLQTTIPVFGLLIAHFHLPGERITAAKAIGVAIGIAGVAIVFSSQLEARGTAALLGSAAIVVGAFAAAYANVLVKARKRNLDPAVLAGTQMIFGLVPLLAVGLATEGDPRDFHWSPMAIVALVYLALVGSALAFFLYYWLVAHMDVTKTMFIALVTPLIAVVLGMVVLDEQLTWRTIVGGAAIIAGTALAMLPSAVRAAKRPNEARAGAR